MLFLSMVPARIWGFSQEIGTESAWDFNCVSLINWKLTMQSPMAIRNVSCGTFEESASSVRKMRSIFRTCFKTTDKLKVCA